jgi:tRNA(Ile)-lysidine synthase TilS/MesJ
MKESAHLELFSNAFPDKVAWPCDRFAPARRKSNSSPPPDQTRRQSSRRRFRRTGFDGFASRAEKLSARHKWKIDVAHFNHQLRGRASDADEKLVRKTAAAMKLPICCGKCGCERILHENQNSQSKWPRGNCAMNFSHVARRRKIQTVALAHHADDQVELFFCDCSCVVREGGEGLAGMKWQSPSPADKKISSSARCWIFQKERTSEFARENKIKFPRRRDEFFL